MLSNSTLVPNNYMYMCKQRRDLALAWHLRVYTCTVILDPAAFPCTSLAAAACGAGSTGLVFLLQAPCSDCVQTSIIQGSSKRSLLFVARRDRR